MPIASCDTPESSVTAVMVAETTVAVANALQTFFADLPKTPDARSVDVDMVTAQVLLPVLVPFFLKHETARESAIAVASAAEDGIGDAKHVTTLFAASVLMACLSAGINEKAAVVARLFEHQLVEFLQVAVSPSARQELVDSARAALPGLVADLFDTLRGLGRSRSNSTAPPTASPTASPTAPPTAPPTASPKVSSKDEMTVLRSLGSVCSAYTRQRVLTYPRHLPAIIGALRGVAASEPEPATVSFTVTAADADAVRVQIAALTERVSAIEDGRDEALDKMHEQLKGAIDRGTTHVADSVKDLLNDAAARAAAAEQIADAAEKRAMALETRVRLAERKLASVEKNVSAAVDRAVLSALDGVVDRAVGKLEPAEPPELAMELAKVRDEIETAAEVASAAALAAVDDACKQQAETSAVLAGRIDRVEASLRTLRPVIDESLCIIARRVDENQISYSRIVERVAALEATVQRTVARLETRVAALDAHDEQLAKLRWVVQNQLVAQWNANAAAWTAFHNAFVVAGPAPVHVSVPAVTAPDSSSSESSN